MKRFREVFHNPLLPEDVFVPDVEAHVWEDGRIYLYGSYDVRGKQGYCSEEYHVFSSPDMIRFTDHGVAFRFSDAKWAHDCAYRALYAPDCAYRDGRYYLYYCIPDGRCGVAVSDKPYGPFEDVGQMKDLHGIDPAVLIDGDGQAYIYWGQFDGVRSAKLNRDMVSIDVSSVTQPLSVAEHDFHEGSSVKKINGKYVYLYTDTHRHKDVKAGGTATCLGYAVSDEPQRGFRYGGVVIDNYGCDPKTWNNHGSIAEFNGQWYVFYHRSTHGGEFSRRVCAEKIVIGQDCGIKEAVMTSGEIGRGMTVPAGAACMLSGSVRVGGARLGLVGAEEGDTAVYRYAKLGGCGAVRLDGDGGEAEVYAGGSFLCRAKTDGSVSTFAPLCGDFEIMLRFTDCKELYSLEFI